MKITTKLFIVVTLLALNTTAAYSDSNTASVTDINHIILVTGQSNVQGSQSTTTPPSPADTTHPRVFAYTSSNDWEKADLKQAWDVDGWHPGNGSLSDASRTHYNSFAFHFAKTIANGNPNIVVGIIVASAPGKAISHWNNNSAFSQIIDTKVVAALNAQGVKSALDGILWHQGETDWQYHGTSDPNASAQDASNPTYYPQKLKALIENFRSKNWFSANKPFICGETKQALVNPRLMELNSDGDPWTGCVVANDLPTREQDDTTTPPKLGTHFTATGLRALGNRYGSKFITMTSALPKNDTENPILTMNPVEATAPGLVTISGNSNDNDAIDRNKLLIRNTSSGQYWNGSSWTNKWAWFSPVGTNSWSYEITLTTGGYTATAWTWDTSNNIGNIANESFLVGSSDIAPPTVTINLVNQTTPGPTTISGSSTDNIAIDRNKLLIRDTSSGQYWSGSEWTNDWSWFTPAGSGIWSYNITLSTGVYTTTAWTWDTSNNLGNIETLQLSIGSNDTTPPTVNIVGPTAQSSVSTGDVFIYINSDDDAAIDRNKLLVRNQQTGKFWNGQQWVPDWSWFTPGSGTLESAYSVLLIIDEGQYKVIAWTWDTSNNVSAYDQEIIDVQF